MDKSKLKKRVQGMSAEEREELGHLLLESVLERMSEEERGEESDDSQTIGGFDLIVEDDPEPG